MRGGTPTNVRTPSLLRPLGRRTALRRRQDAASALFGLCDADEFLVDAVCQNAPERRIVAAQDDDVTVPLVAQPLGLKTGELLAGVGRGFVVTAEQDDQAAGVLDRPVHRLDEARAERNVVILDDDLVVRCGQNVRDLSCATAATEPRRLRKKSNLSPTAPGIGSSCSSKLRERISM